MKIENDKYYTPIKLANKCIDKVISIIGLEKITDVIEPSCGNGSFFTMINLYQTLDSIYVQKWNL